MQIADVNLGGMVIQQDRRIARFEMVPILNAVKSKQESRPIYDGQIVLFVRQPGERDEPSILAHEGHQYEFPVAWAAFQAGQKVDVNGTPLAVLFPDSAHIVAHMRGLHIFTVEQLAAVSENGAGRIGMGARCYIERAQKFLDAAERAAPMQHVETELRARDEEIALLKEQVAMLARAAQQGDEAPRRRGRAPNMIEGDAA